jgi:putative ABC transport system ATP-binding protein
VFFLNLVVTFAFSFLAGAIYLIFEAYFPKRSNLYVSILAVGVIAFNWSYFLPENGKMGNLTDEELAKMRNERIGFVFQAFHLLPRTSVAENVGLPLLYTKKKMDKQKAIDAAVTAVGLDHRKDHLSNQLSGGEKQRVAIARAIVNNPDIIFADEPTGNLDSKSGNQILKILQDLIPHTKL